MKYPQFKALALIFALIVVFNNLYLAEVYYNISSINLSYNFYRQSGDDILIDNKVEKVQILGESMDFGITHEIKTDAGKRIIIYQVKRDSYRKKWQPR